MGICQSRAIKFFSMIADELNEWFEKGWEYVHGFSQSVSIASGSYRAENGDIMIIIKKQEKVML
jgi:hypothetical protein